MLRYVSPADDPKMAFIYPMLQLPPSISALGLINKVIPFGAYEMAVIAALLLILAAGAAGIAFLVIYLSKKK